MGADSRVAAPSTHSKTVFSGSRSSACVWEKKAICVWRPIVTLPELGSSPPEMRRENVDFPAPFTPTMAMRSPFTISKSTSSKTEMEPYRLETFSSLTTECAPAGGVGK